MDFFSRQFLLVAGKHRNKQTRYIIYHRGKVEGIRVSTQCIAMITYDDNS